MLRIRPKRYQIVSKVDKQAEIKRIHDSIWQRPWNKEFYNIGIAYPYVDRETRQIHTAQECADYCDFRQSNPTALLLCIGESEFEVEFGPMEVNARFRVQYLVHPSMRAEVLRMVPSLEEVKEIQEGCTLTIVLPPFILEG